MHSKLSQWIRGLPTLVKAFLNSTEPFKGWQPLRPFGMPKINVSLCKVIGTFKIKLPVRFEEQ